MFRKYKQFSIFRRLQLSFLLVLGIAFLQPAMAEAQFNYADNGNGTVTITGYTGTSTEVTIPTVISVGGTNKTVIGLGDYAFQNSSVTSVIVPEGVASIGFGTFQNSKLINIVLPDSITSIGSYAFLNCGMTSIHLGPKLTNIGGYTFANSQLAQVDIPDSVTNIGSYAFATTPLANVTIGAKVPNIKTGTFINTKLTSVIIPGSVTYIGDYAFESSLLASVAIGANVTSIGASAFQGTRLTSVVIPDSVTSLGGGATFYGCPLASITIGSHLTNIPLNAFSHTQLTNVVIPDTVAIIGDSAFSSCPIANVKIGANVTSIGDHAFSGCPLTSLVLPDSVTSIGPSAFHGCPIANVSFGANVAVIGSYSFGSTNLTTVTIPDSVTAIGDSAFAGCPLASVSIGHHVKYISDNAFLATDLTDVVIPDSVVSLGNDVFAMCPLATITIGANVATIGLSAFAFCTSLTTVICTGSAPVPNSNVFYHADSATVYYLPNRSGWGATFSGRPTSLIMPPSITSGPMASATLAGANTFFSVTINSLLAPSYQWQVSTDGGVVWANLTDGLAYNGATTANLTVNASTANQLGYQYRAAISNLAGTTTTAPAPLLVGSSLAKLNWLQNNFTSVQWGDPAIVGDEADPAGDGIPNLVKYAFNFDPWTNGRLLLPQASAVAGNLTFVFPVSRMDLVYTVEASTDLQNWSTAGVTQIYDAAHGTITGSYSLSPNSPTYLKIAITPAP